MYLPDHIGFSGSRLGMSERQTTMVTMLLNMPKLKGQELWFHHGLCRGADHEAHDIARRLNYMVWGHPALDRSYEQTELVRECSVLDGAYSYHGRNHRIVIATRLLIAAPYDNSGRGGTWWTIGCSRRMKKPRIIVHRDGSILREEGC